MHWTSTKPSVSFAKHLSQDADEQVCHQNELELRAVRPTPHPKFATDWIITHHFSCFGLHIRLNVNICSKACCFRGIMFLLSSTERLPCTFCRAHMCFQSRGNEFGASSTYVSKQTGSIIELLKSLNCDTVSNRDCQHILSKAVKKCLHDSVSLNFNSSSYSSARCFSSLSSSINCLR